jgi:hypothetical protein
MESVKELEAFISNAELQHASNPDVSRITRGWQGIMEKEELRRVKQRLEEALHPENSDTSLARPAIYRTSSQEHRVAQHLDPVLDSARLEVVDLASLLRAALRETHEAFLQAHQAKFAGIKDKLDRLRSTWNENSLHSVDVSYMQLQIKSVEDTLGMLSQTEGALEVWESEDFKRLQTKLAEIDHLRDHLIGQRTNHFQAYSALLRAGTLQKLQQHSARTMDLKGSQMVTDRIGGLVRALRPTPPTALQAVVQRSGAARSLVMKFRPPHTRQDIYRWRFCDGSTVDERSQALVTHRPFTEAGFIDEAGGAGGTGTPTKKGGERVVRDSLLIYQVERAGDGSTVCRNLKCTVPNKAGVFCFRMSQLMVGTEYSFRVRAGYPVIDSWSEWTESCVCHTKSYDLEELQDALLAARNAAAAATAAEHFVRVNRDTACTDLLGLAQDKWRGDWLVEFQGEQGVDAGGLFIDLLVSTVQELFDPQFGLFRQTENQEHLEPHPESDTLAGPEHLRKFRLLGRLLAKALLYQIPLAVSPSPTVVKRLLSLPLELEDVESVNPELFRTLSNVLVQDVSEWGLTFEQDTESCTGGERVAIDLTTGHPADAGVDARAVTNANKREFVALKLRHNLSHKFGPQLDEMERGKYLLDWRLWFTQCHTASNHTHTSHRLIGACGSHSI